MLNFSIQQILGEYNVRVPDVAKLIEESSKIVKGYNYQGYVNILLEYWTQNPPTLGHGFLHCLFVAINAYHFGKLNKYPNPEHLFVGGLFHDVHREAEGRDGDESQIISGEIINKLFNSYDVSPAIAYKVISAVSSHDSWRVKDNPPKYDMLLSFADKSAMTTISTYGYMWSSNKTLELNGEEKSYKSHLSGLAGFAAYQTRAWEIFNKFSKKVNGSQSAVKAYIDTFNETTGYYLMDDENEDFDEILLGIAKIYKDLEQKLLVSFDRSESDIEKLMGRYLVEEG